MKKQFLFLACLALLSAHIGYADDADTTTSTTVTATTTTFIWSPFRVIGGGRGTEVGYLYDPKEVDVVNGSLYVVEGCGRVQKFNLQGGYADSYGEAGEDDGGLFDEPSGVAFRAADENTTFLYVSDTKNYRIQMYWRHINSSESSYNWTYYGERIYGDYFPQSHIYFDKPAGIEVGPDGVLYVANTGMDRISMFEQPLNYSNAPRPSNRTEFDGASSANGPLSEPKGVAVYNGTVYVADTGNDLIRLFQKDGTQILSFGGSGSGRGEFSAPNSLSVDESGNIYIADTGNNRVVVYNSQGMYVTGFGTENCTTSIYSKPTLAAGQFCSPQGIEAMNGSLYVADTGNHRIQVYNISVLPEASCIRPGDDAPCGQASLLEVMAHINRWAIGEAELSDVIALINMWLTT